MPPFFISGMILLVANKARYPTSADIDTLFVTPATAGFFETDGVVDLTIMGRQRDRTAGQNVM